MEIIDNYLYIDTDKNVLTKKKITGHSFVALADVDKWKKKVIWF